MSITDYLSFGSDPIDDLVDGLHGIQADGDAVALLPYDDGTFYMKPAYFDKELVGGQGGYETDDGDKIVVDGDGTAKRSLFGVDILLAVDPTEHAAAVDPIKALVAQKDNIGEWIRVDSRGNVVDVGDAVEPAADSEFGQAVQEADDVHVESDGGVAVQDGQNMVRELADEQNISYERAMAELAKTDDVRKIYDIAPPAGVVYDDGEFVLEEATHIAVDQSKAADLLPTTTDTVELNTALDKARMEEHEEGKLMKYFVYGGIAGVLTTAFVGGGMLVMMMLSGGALPF